MMEIYELINKNPYRILDISGCSSQAKIFRAVDKAKRISKIKHVGLGQGLWEEKFDMEPILFSEAQINNAQLILNDPKERFINRVLGVMDNNEENLPSSLKVIAKKHDEIILNLIEALDDEFLFIMKLCELNELVDCEEYLRLNKYIEDSGQFTMTEINISDCLKYFKAIEKKILKECIGQAMKEEYFASVTFLGDYIDCRNTDLFDDEIKSTFVNKLEEFIEKEINEVYENEFSHFKRENVIEEYRQENSSICANIINRYEPVFNEIVVIASKNYSWMLNTTRKRIIEHCVQFYNQLAVDLTWADDYENANIYIKKAISNCQDTDVYKKLEDTRGTIESSIEIIQSNKLQISNNETTKVSLNQMPSSSKNNKSSSKFIFLSIAILAIFVMFFGTNNSSSNNSQSGSTNTVNGYSTNSDSKSELRNKMDNLYNVINTEESELGSLSSELDSLESDIDSESDNDMKNQYIDEYNSKLEEYNSIYSTYSNNISQYNTWVKQFNGEN